MISDDDILRHARYDQKFAIRRRLQFVSFALRNFLLGIQYSIILPSAWQYMKRLGVGYTIYGVILSMYPLGAFLSSLFIGWLFDKTKRTKELISVLNLALVMGNLMYSLHFSLWLPICGRFVAGIGEAGNLVSFGEISLLTTAEQRAATYSYVLMGVIPGVFLGPLISWLLKNVKINIGKLYIDYTNAPGIFGACMWLFMFIICQFMTTNLAKEFHESQRKRQSQAEGLLSEENNLSGHEEKGSLRRKKLSTESYDLQMRSVDKESECTSIDGENEHLHLKETLKEVASCEILAIYAASFSTWFLLLETDSLLPLVTQEDFKWTVVDTNIVYMLGAGWAGLIYIIIGILGNRMSNIFCVVTMQIIAILAAVLAISYQMNRGHHIVPQVLFCSVLLCLFAVEPLNSAGSNALLSAVTPFYMKGHVLLGSNFVLMFAAIVAPIWGTYFYRNMILCASVNIGLSTISLFWLSLSLKRLKERERMFGTQK